MTRPSLSSGAPRILLSGGRLDARRPRSRWPGSMNSPSSSCTPFGVMSLASLVQRAPPRPCAPGRAWPFRKARARTWAARDRRLAAGSRAGSWLWMLRNSLDSDGRSQFGHGSGQLHAGGPAADHDEGEQARLDRRVVLLFRLFEGRQDAPADFQGLFHRLEAGSQILPIVDGRNSCARRRRPGSGSRMRRPSDSVTTVLAARSTGSDGFHMHAHLARNGPASGGWARRCRKD